MQQTKYCKFLKVYLKKKVFRLQIVFQTTAI